MVIPKIFKNKYTVFPFTTSVIILLISLSIFYLKLADTQSLLIVNFDNFKGINFLGDKSDVLNIILFGFSLIGINILLAYVLYLRERFFSYILAFISPLFTLLILIDIIAIISIN